MGKKIEEYLKRREKKDRDHEKYEAIAKAWMVDTKPHRLFHRSRIAWLRQFLKGCNPTLNGDCMEIGIYELVFGVIIALLATVALILDKVTVEVWLNLILLLLGALLGIAYGFSKGYYRAAKG